MPESQPAASAEPRETARLEAFSDGVIAIAATLLIIGIAVPRLAVGQTLPDALLRQWPSYLAYLISFTTILIMWLNHHTLFKIIRRVDHSLIILNGLLLMMITFVNFPTAVLAEYIETPSREVAALFYSGTFTVTAIAFNALWRYASHDHRLLDRSVDPAYVQGITRQYFFGPTLYFVAFLAAFVSAWLSLAIDAGLAIFFCFPGVLKWMRPRN